MRRPRSPRRNVPGTKAGARFFRAPRATLLFFGAIGLLLWGRLLLKEVPQTASAIDPPAAAAPASLVSPEAAEEEKEEDSVSPGSAGGQVGS